MGNLSNTDHEIYKKRGRMNAQIGIVLGVFVILVMIATIAKLASGEGMIPAINASPNVTPANPPFPTNDGVQ